MSAVKGIKNEWFKRFCKRNEKRMKKKRFWTEKKRKSVVWMCKMRKGSENKKKERKKNETIEKAVIRFDNGGNDGGDVSDGVCTGKCIGGRR